MSFMTPWDWFYCPDDEQEEEDMTEEERAYEYDVESYSSASETEEDRSWPPEYQEDYLSPGTSWDATAVPQPTEEEAMTSKEEEEEAAPPVEEEQMPLLSPVKVEDPKEQQEDPPLLSPPAQVVPDVDVVIEDQTEEVIPPTPRKTGIIRVRWPSASPPPRMLFVGGRWMRRRDLSVVQEEEEVEEVSDKEEDFQSSGSEWFPRDSDLSSSSSEEEEAEVATEVAEEDQPPQVATSVEEAETPGEPAMKRCRTSAPKRRGHQGGQKAQRDCPFEGCPARVVNMAQHFRQVHPGQLQPAKASKPRTYGGHKQCPVCSGTTVRMDLHLARVHKFTKGTKMYKEAMEEAVAPRPQQEGEAPTVFSIDEALTDYGLRMEDRSTGRKRAAGSKACHETGIKFFLSQLSQDDIRGLTSVGQKAGVIDSAMEAGRIRARSVKSYLHSLANFLEFLSGEDVWLKRLGMSSQDMLTVKQKMLTIASSLKEDINRQAMEEAGQAEEGALQLEPWMVGAYLDGPDREICRGLIQRAAIHHEPLTNREFCSVRNSLVLQLLVTNFKRAGDLSHLKRDTVLNATADAESGSEMYIITHKEARSGKRCPLKVDGIILEDLQLFARHLAKVDPQANPNSYLFTTFLGREISPTNMSKMIETAWAAFGKASGLTLPKMTASLGRKLAVTTLREMGSSREEQSTLAAHMAHRVETADKYYNKAQLKQQRASVVKKVTEEYTRSAKARFLAEMGLEEADVESEVEEEEG